MTAAPVRPRGRRARAARPDRRPEANTRGRSGGAKLEGVAEKPDAENGEGRQVRSEGSALPPYSVLALSPDGSGFFLLAIALSLALAALTFSAAFASALAFLSSSRPLASCSAMAFTY